MAGSETYREEKAAKKQGYHSLVDKLVDYGKSDDENKLRWHSNHAYLGLPEEEGVLEMRNLDNVYWQRSNKNLKPLSDKRKAEVAALCKVGWRKPTEHQWKSARVAAMAALAPSSASGFAGTFAMKVDVTDQEFFGLLGCAAIVFCIFLFAMACISYVVKRGQVSLWSS